MRLEAVELAVFGTGIGFLILEFVPRGLPKGRDLGEIAPPAGSPTTWIELSKVLRRGDLFHSRAIHTRFGDLLGAESELTCETIAE